MKKKITFKVRKPGTTIEMSTISIVADVDHGYAVHRTIAVGKSIIPYWTITHVKSGAALGIWYESAKQAKEYRNLLKTIESVDGKLFSDMDLEDALQAVPIIAARMADLSGQDPTLAAINAERSARQADKLLRRNLSNP